MGECTLKYGESKIDLQIPDEVMNGEMRVSKDIEATINARIADIDALLSKQLNAIMHAPEFQKLEGSWRGLNYLVQQTETSTTLKLRVLVRVATVLKSVEFRLRIVCFWATMKSLTRLSGLLSLK